MFSKKPINRDDTPGGTCFLLSYFIKSKEKECVKKSSIVSRESICMDVDIYPCICFCLLKSCMDTSQLRDFGMDSRWRCSFAYAYLTICNHLSSRILHSIAHLQPGSSDATITTNTSLRRRPMRHWRNPCNYKTPRVPEANERSHTRDIPCGHSSPAGMQYLRKALRSLSQSHSAVRVNRLKIVQGQKSMSKNLMHPQNKLQTITEKFLSWSQARSRRPVLWHSRQDRGTIKDRRIDIVSETEVPEPDTAVEQNLFVGPSMPSISKCITKQNVICCLIKRVRDQKQLRDPPGSGDQTVREYKIVYGNQNDSRTKWDRETHITHDTIQDGDSRTNCGKEDRGSSSFYKTRKDPKN